MPRGDVETIRTGFGMPWEHPDVRKSHGVRQAIWSRERGTASATRAPRTRTRLTARAGEKRDVAHNWKSPVRGCEPHLPLALTVALGQLDPREDLRRLGWIDLQRLGELTQRAARLRFTRSRATLCVPAARASATSAAAYRDGIDGRDQLSSAASLCHQAFSTVSGRAMEGNTERVK